MEALHGSVAPSDPLRRASRFLEGLLDIERSPGLPYARLGLDAIERLLDRVGRPHQGLSVVHVAGSKGKGSTALFVESILTRAGERVGTFTSPHLTDWTERFRVRGRPVEPASLAACLDTLRPHVETLRREGPARAPTFFDVTTAAAFLLFRDAGLDRVVLEVGLGGRLDSTNVVDPAVSCITSLELEHTDRLGGTLAEIAHEKAGVVKRGRPLVLGPVAPEGERVVSARCREMSAPMFRFGHEFGVGIGQSDLDGVKLRVEDGGWSVDASLAVPGRHQARNAALAVACVRRLPGGDALRPEAVAEGLAAARLPGRIEVVGRAPWIVVDSSHTVASARALADSLEPFGAAHTDLVLSVSAGKDLEGVLEALLPRAGRLTVTRAEPRRSLAAHEVAAAVRRLVPNAELRVVPNPFLAVRAARERLAPHDLLCITGSIYLAGIARRVLLRAP